MKTEVPERSGIGAETPFAIGVKTVLVLSNQAKKRPETNGAETSEAESRHDPLFMHEKDLSTPGQYKIYEVCNYIS